jgi:hypothetical protein
VITITAGRLAEAEWARTPAARALHAGALAVALVLGVAVLLVQHRGHPADALEHPAHPMTDDQTASQVVDAAKQIITVAGLDQPRGGYALLSCKNEYDPPYQGTVYLNFTLPNDQRIGAYLETLAATLGSHGWRTGLPPNQHMFGITLTKNGVTAVIHRHSDFPNLGILQVYGQCRDMNDHRNDQTAWTEITDELR